jgi:hypothetical protein
MADIADFMDWNALYQMTQEIQERLKLLRGESFEDASLYGKISKYSQ